eukprot:Hpha_TRINITY_DN15359_c3_g5::TRINITY_DN15359_c3_g5_i3::g.88233::m.88233
MGSDLLSQRKAVVADFFVSMAESRQVDALGKLMAPDATWVYAPETISRIQKGKNKAEILAWLGGLKNDFDGFKLVPSLLIGEGDVVMAKTRSTATHRLVGPYAQDYMFTFIFAPGSLRGATNNALRETGSHGERASNGQAMHMHRVAARLVVPKSKRIKPCLAAPVPASRSALLATPSCRSRRSRSSLTPVILRVSLRKR